MNRTISIIASVVSQSMKEGMFYNIEGVQDISETCSEY